MSHRIKNILFPCNNNVTVYMYLQCSSVPVGEYQTQHLHTEIGIKQESQVNILPFNT